MEGTSQQDLLEVIRQDVTQVVRCLALSSGIRDSHVGSDVSHRITYNYKKDGNCYNNQQHFCINAGESHHGTAPKQMFTMEPSSMRQMQRRTHELGRQSVYKGQDWEEINKLQLAIRVSII